MLQGVGNDTLIEATDTDAPEAHDMCYAEELTVRLDELVDDMLDADQDEHALTMWTIFLTTCLRGIGESTSICSCALCHSPALRKLFLKPKR